CLAGNHSCRLCRKHFGAFSVRNGFRGPRIQSPERMHNLPARDWRRIVRIIVLSRLGLISAGCLLGPASAVGQTLGIGSLGKLPSAQAEAEKASRLTPAGRFILPESAQADLGLFADQDSMAAHTRRGNRVVGGRRPVAAEQFAVGEWENLPSGVRVWRLGL